MSEPAKRIWHRLLNELETMRVLSTVDGRQLERYCTYFVRWRECETFISKNGTTYPMKSDDPACYVGKIPDGTAIVGFVEYPQVKESHRLDKALKQIEAAFGLTPSARSRLTTAPEKEPTKEGKDRFFAEGA